MNISQTDAKRVLGEYLMLDVTEACGRDEWEQRKASKRRLVERLLTSEDDEVLTIALKLQLNGHAGNVRHLIQRWLDRP